MQSGILSRLKLAYYSGEIYDTCNTLPLSIFIQVSKTQNLKLLIKSGKATNKALGEAWDKIIDEYCLISNDTKSKALLSCYKEIATLTNDLIIIQTIVNYLYLHRSEAVIEKLRTKFGFRYSYSAETLQKDLKLTVSESKAKLVRIEQRKKGLETMQKESKGELSDADFEENLTVLSKYQGYRLISKEITVTEYLSIMKMFKLEHTPKDGRTRKVNGNSR